MAMGLAWALGARRTHSSCTNPLYIELPERLIELCVLIKLCNKNPMALVLTLITFWKTLRCNVTLRFSEMTDHATSYH